MEKPTYYLKLFIKCKTEKGNLYCISSDFELKNIIQENELNMLKQFMCISVEKETNEKIISSEFISKEEYDGFQMEENEFDVIVEE